MTDDKKQPDDLKIKVDGREYPFPSFDTLSYREARTIKRLTETEPGSGNGLVIGQFFKALEKGDPDALFVIAYIAKRRDDPSFKPEDLEDLKLDEIEIVTPPAPEEDMKSPLDVPLVESDEQSSTESKSKESERLPI